MASQFTSTAREISTDLGTYVIYQATGGRYHLEGDTVAGEWHFQPDDWDGDEFSSGYPTREAAEVAALEYVVSEIAAQNAE